MTTTFKIMVEVEADSREQADEKVWQMYNNEEIDPLNADDIDTETKWRGYADE